MSARLTIAGLNDLLRTTFLTGRVVITEGIRGLSPDTVSDILTQVRAFNAFTPDNDPYGEHDFGSIEHADAGRVFWKIDYYDPTLTAGSEDPADPKRTTRVLTIMLAEEY
jgi:hypothetical protein